MNPTYMVAAAISALAPWSGRARKEDPMQYLCLIYEDEKAWQTMPPAESEKKTAETGT